MDELTTLDREAEQIVKEIGIPPCPATLTRLLREMREDEPNFERIGQFISSDVSLAASMLKTANSPFFGLRTKATSVHQSLVMLGLHTVANLVTGLLLRQAFPVTANASMESFWETSSNVAIICAYLASELRCIERNEAYTFGLFRDCGMPLMVAKFPGYHKVYASAKPALERPITTIEDDHYAMNHARVGFHLAQSWKLNDDMCQAILFHHDHAMLQSSDEALGSASRQFIALALIAEQLYTQRANGKDCLEWSTGGALARSSLDISEDQYLSLSKKLPGLSSGT